MSADDTGFCFPLEVLENKRMRLEPFDLAKHGPSFVEGVKDRSDLFQYMPMGPYPTLNEVRHLLDVVINSTKQRTLMAVTIKSGIFGENEVFAGIVGYLNASETDLVIEIGFITILPRFQGTFVAKNATGLLIKYAMDAPPHGLGLRRCVWQAHALNVASRKFADKMLFTYEGTRRFERTMPMDKPGNGYDTTQMPDVFGRRMNHSRDSAMYAHYCDEWEQKRPLLQQLMDR